jgi:hypothetical protein
VRQVFLNPPRKTSDGEYYEDFADFTFCDKVILTHPTGESTGGHYDNCILLDPKTGRYNSFSMGNYSLSPQKDQLVTWYYRALTEYGKYKNSQGYVKSVYTRGLHLINLENPNPSKMIVDGMVYVMSADWRQV